MGRKELRVSYVSTMVLIANIVSRGARTRAHIKTKSKIMGNTAYWYVLRLTFTSLLLHPRPTCLRIVSPTVD